MARLVAATTDLLSLLPFSMRSFFKVTDITVVGDIYGCDVAEDPDLKVGLPYARIVISRSNTMMCFDDMGLSLFQNFNVMYWLGDRAEMEKGRTGIKPDAKPHSLGIYSIIKIKEINEDDRSCIEVIGIHPWYIFQDVCASAYSAQNTPAAVVKEILKNTNSMAYIKDKVKVTNLGVADGPELPYYRTYETDLQFIQKIITPTNIKDSPTLFFVDMEGYPKLTSYSDLATNGVAGVVFCKPKKTPVTYKSIDGRQISMDGAGSSTTINASVCVQALGYDPNANKNIYHAVFDEDHIEVGGNWKNAIVRYISDISNIGDAAMSLTLGPAIKATDSHKEEALWPFNRVGYNFATATKTNVAHHLHNNEAAYVGLSELRGAESLIKIKGPLMNFAPNFGAAPNVGDVVFYGAGSYTSGLNGQYICSKTKVHFHLVKPVENASEICSISSDVCYCDVDGEIELVRPFLDEWFRSLQKAHDNNDIQLPTAFAKGLYEVARV